jgi:hypothetical protein
VKKVTELWAAYNNALPLGMVWVWNAFAIYRQVNVSYHFLGKTLEKTERQYGDDYVVLASHILLKIYRENEDMAFILHALVLLESALAKSIYNFQFKILLIRLYLIIGRFDLALPWLCIVTTVCARGGWFLNCLLQVPLTKHTVSFQPWMSSTSSSIPWRKFIFWQYFRKHLLMSFYI